MTDTKQRCGATHPKQPKETCNRELGHVGMHTNGGNVTWKGPKPAPPKEPSLTDKCPKCSHELGEHDGNKCPPKGSVADRVYAMIVAEPGRTAPQIGRGYSKAIAGLEADGRIEWRDDGWWPAQPAKRSPLTLDDEPEDQEADEAAIAAMGDEEEPDDLEMRTLARQQREAREAHASEVEAAMSSKTLKVHPAADALPLIEGPEYDALVEDIRVNGQRHDIVIDFTGEWLVDGRNRRRACLQLGLSPRCQRLPEGTDIAAYVISTNLKRRHLTESQRAMIASRIANLSQGQHKTRPGGGFEKKVTQAEAAKMSGVGERTVQRANAVSDKAVPELVDAVVAGKVDLKGAEQVAKLSPSQQRQLLKERVDTSKGPVRAGKLAAVARQEKKRETVRNINSGKVRPMPAGMFGVIYVDYPWKYENSDQHDSARGHAPYPQMTMEAIYTHAAEAAKRAGKDCVIALWVTNPYIGKIERVIEAYGAVQNTMLTWPKPKMGMGPKFSRSQTEHLVIATIGNPVHTLNEISTLLPSYELREHSRKPDEVAELLQKHCSGPFLELFSQEEREGWTTWGAEAGKYDGKAA